jgi:hypothetical protein
MQVLTLKRIYTDAEAEKKFHKKFLTDADYNFIVKADTDAYNSQGQLLFKFRKNVIPYDTLKLGYESFKDSIEHTEGRGAASGSSHKRILKNGTVSKITVGNYVESGNVGYMDSAAMVPYCRKTAFARQYFDKFKEGIPFVQKIDKLYEELCPAHYSRQINIARATNRNYVIDDTSFTTITVNKNFVTAVHKDSGDYQQGFGNLCVYREGEYEGCYFCLPEYAVAIDMQNTDMLFVDVHRWHGNTPFRNQSADSLRISFVMYYRENMIACKQPSEELARIKKDKGGFYKI